MARVYVGNLDERVTERDLQQDFDKFGRVNFIWVAKKPPGFAFVDYEDDRDAEDAVRKMNGANGWRVEISRKSHGARGGEPRGGGGGGRGGGGRGGGREMACYNCGEVGHLARDCRARGVPSMRRGDRDVPRRDYRRSPSPRGRSRSRSPFRRDSPPPRRRDSPPPRRDSRSPPLRRSSPSPRRDSRTPPPRRDVSRSP